MHVAVCIAGQLRTSNCKWRNGRYPPAQSIREHLLDALRALPNTTVDVFAALDGLPRHHQTLPGATAPSLQRVLSLLQPVQAVMLDEAEDDAAYSSVSRRRFPTETLNASEACSALSRRVMFDFSRASLSQARKLGACWQVRAGAC